MKELERRAEAYKMACIALDRTASMMGARAIVVTYRIDEEGEPIDVAVMGGCCAEHVVRALKAGAAHVSQFIEEEDEDCVEGMTIN